VNPCAFIFPRSPNAFWLLDEEKSVGEGGDWVNPLVSVVAVSVSDGLMSVVEGTVMTVPGSVGEGPLEAA
jgi:hypothetical protein